MYPILFEIPGLGFPVRSFGVMVALGFVLGTSIYARLVERNSDDPAGDAERHGHLPIWVLIGVMGGARLMYVVVEIGQGTATGASYLDNPLLIFAIWQGGLVMYGGMAGGILAGMWCCKRHEIPVANAVDMGLSVTFLGLAVGRLGCLLVGDDYGKIVPEAYAHLPFPITVTVPQVLPAHSLFGPENAGQVLWATQIWMSVNALVLGLLGLWLLKRRSYPGQVTLVLVLIYSVVRFTIETFRGDAVRGKWFNDALSTSQVVSIGAFLLMATLLVRARARRTPATHP